MDCPALVPRLAAALPALALILATGSGCSTTAYRRDPTAGWSLHHRPIGADSRALLDDAGVAGHPGLHPGPTFAQAESRLLSDPTPEGLLTLSELAARLARKAGPLDGDEAARRHRDSAAYAALAMADPRLGPESPGAARARRLHDEGVAALLRRADREGDPVDRLIEAEVVVRVEDPGVDPRRYRGLRAASDMDLGAIPIHGEPGIGLPVVAEREFTDDEPRSIEEGFYGRRMSVPLTAMLRPRGPARDAAWRLAPPELVLYDALIPREVPLDDGDASRLVPLASDVTTPVVYQFSNRNLENLRWAGLFLPELASRRTGVYLLQPYRRDKIPVLFVHGLWSSPKTWLAMTNALMADPEMRARYQFWYAYYPTGEPILRSILEVRRSLRAVVQGLDPSGEDSASRGIVLVAHSMGAVISRALLIDSGDRLERMMFTRPLDQLTMTPDTRRTLTDALLLRPEQGIARAILVAGPFRGSRAANASLGRFASRLVRPPGDLDAIRQEILELNGPEAAQPGRGRRVFNGVDDLEENSPVLTNLIESPTASRAPLHTVIAIRQDARGRGDATDGIVPYASAHLDDATSETIISGNHYCNDDPPAIAEVARLLRLHLREIDGAGPSPTPAMPLPLDPTSQSPFAGPPTP